MKKQRNGLFVALSLVVVCAFATPVLAEEEWWTYYDGCGQGQVTTAGYHGHFCDNVNYQGGTQEGHWLSYQLLDCNDPDEYQEFFEWCDSGGWKVVDQQDIWAGNCTCDGSEKGS